MKRSIVAFVALMGALAFLLWGLRREHGPDANLTRTVLQERAAAPTANAKVFTGQLPQDRAPGQNSTSNAGPEVLAQTTGDAAVLGNIRAPGDRARDEFYDRLLSMQGRDQAKEEQLVSRLMAVFGDSPDTLLGPIACSAEFCRVELKGFGKVDVHESWKPALFAAVEPKGLKIFIVAADDEANTIASCYFGRDESWTVPDFHALGLL